MKMKELKSVQISEQTENVFGKRAFLSVSLTQKKALSFKRSI
jgi:hypothetical protein